MSVDVLQERFVVTKDDYSDHLYELSPRQARLWSLRILSVGLLLGIWTLLTALKVWSPLILPSPGQVWRAFQQSISIDGRRRGLSGHMLWEHLGASLLRILKGVGYAVVVGPPIGLLLATSRRARAMFEPWLSFLRSLPPLGYFSLLIIWFGIDDTSKVWLLFLAALPPIAIATVSGVERVRQDRVHGALALGASRRGAIRHVILPSALPDLLTGLRVAFGFAWTTIVAAETANGIPGIGGLAWATKKENRTDIAILCVIVIGITAVLLDQVLQRIEHWLVPWKAHA